MYSNRHSMDNLPDHFVQSMRTLFDIMDVERSGYIRYEDLARRWADNPPEATGIPAGFLECLKEVTPVNGMLNFERFRAGLRLALSLNAREKENDLLENRRVPARPPKKEGLIKRRSPPHHARRYSSQPTVNSNYENLPKSPVSNYENLEALRQESKLPTHWQPAAFRRPPAPPPYDHAVAKSVQHIPEFQSNGLRQQILPPPIHRHSKPVENGSASLRQAVPPLPAPGSTISGLVEGSHVPKIPVKPNRPPSVLTSSSGASSSIATVIPPNGAVKWRQKSNLTVITDQRRHTFSDGKAEALSQKHARVLEEEKELLERGLGVATRLRNWYNERLSKLETRQRYAGKSMIPLDLAVHEEKLNYLRAHVTQVNRRMVTLMESSEKAFPAHMNLELGRGMPQPEDDNSMFMRKQNQALTQEVSSKSEEIRKLEAEKAELAHKLRMASMQRSQPTSSLSSGTPSPPYTESHKSSPPSRFSPHINYHNGHHRDAHFEATLI